MNKLIENVEKHENNKNTENLTQQTQAHIRRAQANVWNKPETQMNKHKNEGGNISKT